MWPMHARIVQYFTIDFQKEPMFVRFIDRWVGGGVCIWYKGNRKLQIR